MGAFNWVQWATQLRFRTLLVALHATRSFTSVGFYDWLSVGAGVTHIPITSLSNFTGLTSGLNRGRKLLID